MNLISINVEHTIMNTFKLEMQNLAKVYIGENLSDLTFLAMER